MFVGLLVKALVDLGPVKSFTVRRQEIYYCRKPEQTISSSRYTDNTNTGV